MKNKVNLSKEQQKYLRDYVNKGVHSSRSIKAISFGLVAPVLEQKDWYYKEAESGIKGMDKEQKQRKSKNKLELYCQ